MTVEQRQEEEAWAARWQAAAAELPPGAARALEQCLYRFEAGALDIAPEPDGTWRCVAAESDAYRVTLCFRDMTVQGDADFLLGAEAELCRTETGYCLTVAAPYEEPVRISFSGVELEREYFDYTRWAVFSPDCPWDTVAQWLWMLRDKAEVCGEAALNDRERALLSAEDESTPPDGKKAADEARWRALHDALRAAAGAWPVRNADRAGADLAARERAKVQEVLRGQSFACDYPCFFRRGTLKGLRLRDAHGTTCFVGFGRTMDSHIRCVEQYDGDGRLSISYITGTIFPRTGETAGKGTMDAFSGFFADGNRRFGACLAPGLPVWEGETPVYPDNAEMALLAAKTARMERLSRAEWRMVRRTDRVSTPGFLLAFALLGGAAFGAVMTLGMAFVAALMGLVTAPATGRPLSSLAGLLAGLPWRPLFLWCAGGFGVLMAAVIGVSRSRDPHR